MKTLIIYSSSTGNTQKVAEAIKEVMPKGAICCPVENGPDPDEFDCIAVGFWVDKGTADQKAQTYLKKIKNKKVALFATLGYYPDSKHASHSMANARCLLDSSNEYLGDYICQGKVDEKLIEMFKQFPEGHPHALTPDRIKRYKEAAKHPDENDLLGAQKKFQEIFKIEV